MPDERDDERADEREGAEGTLPEISAEEMAARQARLAQLDLLRRVQRARSGTPEERLELAFDATDDVLNALLDNEATDEEELTIIARRRDVSHEVLRRMAGDRRVQESHRLRRMLVLNPKLPASAGLRLIPNLFLFDLVTVLITPALPLEIKTAAENAILQQYQSLPLGQKITLARRGNGGRLLPQMLNDASADVVRAVLTNPFLTESAVSTAVWKASHQHVVVLIADSARWANRNYVKMALLRNRMLPLGRAVTLVGTLTPGQLKELSNDPTVPIQVRNLVLQQMKKKPGGAA
ncbi:hypothetical protein [Chloracidobacterium thermophilum]|uniref:hypothetical protein n=1 Tax=Chloracidobacterium thermophilum TaxID=458033 RepID=UPI0007385A61|nr:hypothetical protein [Chloracidobacterium thermophilum]